MAASTSQTTPGTTASGTPGLLGQYLVIADIAEGAFGKVKLGVHTLTGHRVALKYISKASVNATQKARLRVGKEIEYLRAVNHPHVIKLYEVINTPTHVILVTEYAGGELFRYIVEHRAIPEPQARRFFQQIMTAIAYLHSIGIVHRDIKPENVLLDEHTNDVKLADFGLSSSIVDGDFLRTYCGSTNYAAPEVISNRPYPGPEIDVWSCGVILYLLLCGRLPFEDDHQPTLFQKIQHGVYHMPSWLSPDTRYLISRMLAVDPVKRITVPDILAHPWTHGGLPTYLAHAVAASAPDPVIGTLSSLVIPDKTVILGIGKIDMPTVNELANAMHVPRDEVLDALQREGENAVKVAYVICKDSRRQGRELGQVLEEDETLEEDEKEDWLAAATSALPTTAADLGIVIGSGDSDPAGVLAAADLAAVEAYDEYSDEYDWSGENNFTILNSSLVVPQPEDPAPLFGPDLHPLQSYERNRSRGAKAEEQNRLRSSSRRRNANVSIRLPPSAMMTASNGQAIRPTLPHTATSRTKPKAPKWICGIRSSSPPMDIMLEVYTSLKLLGAEWKEKRHPWSFQKFPYPPKDYDDISSNADIFFIETRWRVRNYLIRMDIQLYEVDASNYLIDVRNLGQYHISADSLLEEIRYPTDAEYSKMKPDGNPFLFLDCACRLIADLAGERPE